MFDDIEFDIKHYTIGGKLVTGTYTVSQHIILEQNVTSQLVKEQLLKQLIDCVLTNNLAEFTRVENPIDQTFVYRVRCYLAPDDQVKILRTLPMNQFQR